MLNLIKNLGKNETKQVYSIKQVSCHVSRSSDGERLKLTRENGKDVVVIRECSYQDFLDTLQQIADTFPERSINE